jgi:integrase
MKGHVARKRDRYYAVIYEGIDPIDGKEKKSWHAAGTDRAEAEALAARLAAERDGRNDEIRSLTFGAYLTGRWLPAKKLELRTSTYRSYVHKTRRHILPTLGRKRLRRLRPEDLERLYDSMLHPTDGPGPCHPRRSTRCTSSSVARSITPCAAGS